MAKGNSSNHHLTQRLLEPYLHLRPSDSATPPIATSNLLFLLGRYVVFLDYDGLQISFTLVLASLVEYIVQMLIVNFHGELARFSRIRCHQRIDRIHTNVVELGERLIDAILFLHLLVPSFRMFDLLEAVIELFWL